MSALFALFVVLSASVCVGCSIGERSPRLLTSYVSVESTVYGTTAEVVDNVADSVVEIKTEAVATRWGMQYVVSGAGSGVVVAHDGGAANYYIVTNNHVIDGAQQITVTTRSGDSYSASLVATDVQSDIAVVSVRVRQDLKVAVWGNSDNLRIGEDLIAIGNPLGSLGGTVTKGILSATERAIPVGNYTMTLLQTDTAINPGNSGGGLFNMRGELIGVVNAKTSDEAVEGICFAIPSNTARAVSDDLLTDGVVEGRATLGITVAAGSNNIVYVTDAVKASDGTFAVYDRVAAINGKAITSLLTYNDAIATLKPNEQITVKVYRGSLQTSIFGSNIVFAAEPTTFTVTAQRLGKSK